MAGKINSNFTVLSKLYLSFIGCLKAGYTIGLLQSVYYWENNYWEGSVGYQYYYYILMFLVGNFIAGLFCFKMKRSIILGISEIMFILVMAIYSSASNDFSVYVYMIGGGIALLAYPFYAREFFLRDELPRLFVLLWLAVGTGISYCFLVRKVQYQLTFRRFFGMQLETCTPYIFGVLSLINLCLIIFSKNRETIQYYALQNSSSQDLNNLISLFYQPQHHYQIAAQFQMTNPQTNNEALLQNNNQSPQIQGKEKKQHLAPILITAFCAGISQIFLLNLNSYSYMQPLFMNGYGKGYVDDSCYYGYFFILIASSVISSLTLKMKYKKRIAVIGFILSFIVIVIMMIVNKKPQDGQSLIGFLGLTLFILCFCKIAQIIFFIPFFFLKSNKVILYFTILWLGTMFNKMFINGSEDIHKTEIENIYNPHILQLIFTFIGTISLSYVKNI